MADPRIKTVKLHTAQAAIHNSSARFKVVAAGRRFGKTYLAVVTLGIAALLATNARGYALGPENGVYYIAPTAEQARRLVWRRLRAFLGYEKTGGFIRHENINDGYFELVNSRRIYVKGADNEDALRGEGYSHVVLDEYADMKAHVWEDIIEPALMDVEGEALFIGTPKGKNHFWRLFIGALERPADARTGNADHWAPWEAFHFISRDNPFLNSKEIDRISNNPNKSRDSIKQELEASFISGGSKILNPSDFPVIPFKPSFAGNIFITVDLAGFKKQEGNKLLKTDETVICVVMAIEDVWYVLRMEHGHWDVRATASRIVLASREYPGSRLGIEAGVLCQAVQPYLEEYMRTFGRYVTPEPLKHNNQSKQSRIEWALQGRSQRKKILLVAEGRDKDGNSIDDPWVDWFLDQVADFPDPLAHDDGIDALAYVDQMARANFESSQEVVEDDIDYDLYLH